KTYYGPLSSAVSAKCALTAPSSVKLSAVTASSATLSWKAVSSASGYQVYLKSGSGWVKKATVTANKATLKGLSAGTNYTVRIRSYKKIGSSYVYSAATQFAFTTSFSSSSVNPKVMPSTTREICAVYNALVNNAKTERNMTMHKTGTVSLTCTDCSVSYLQGTIDKLLQSFLTPSDDTITVKNGVAKDQDGNRVDLNTYITPSGRAAALKEAYVSSATVKGFSDGYQMTIRLKAEKASFDGTNTVNPNGHNSCLDPLNLATLELPAMAQITAASMEYPGATLTAYVNSSGKLKKLTVKLPLSGSITGELSDISIALALEGVMNEAYDFKY
ncbi:MAG: fibronectin type III domain-containing protein, partial [Oscillospiraceae bacterium]|nr:fibronectin type III domain-containing protein [Oscillospiraceae bacterium]